MPGRAEPIVDAQKLFCNSCTQNQTQRSAFNKYGMNVDVMHSFKTNAVKQIACGIMWSLLHPTLYQAKGYMKTREDFLLDGE